VASARQWLGGARPRTLPAAIVPVLVGSGVAAGYRLFSPWRAALALVVALALLVGAAAVAAAWTYTGGRHPYGYHGLGEVAVFAFFGVAAVVGTAYVQMERVSWLAVAASIPVGLLACALLVINNLRDIPSDTAAGKRTLAVLIGDQRTRLLYTSCALVPFGMLAVLAFARPFSLLALITLPLAVAPVRAVRAGARGPALIAALGQTGRLQLAFGLLLTLGLAIRG